MQNANRRSFLVRTSALSGSLLLGTSLLAQERRDGLTEPIARTAKNQPTLTPGATPHPLDPALKLAYASLNHIRATIQDYTAILIKREQINGVLGDYEYMGVKIRNRKVRNGQIVVPFSVYMTFLKPNSVKGREVIYVENQNDGKIIAHEGGMSGRFLPTVMLEPDGALAMRGQRYPITDLGIENLVVKLIEKGERDKANGMCNVQFHQGVKVGGRPCTLLTVTHDDQQPYYDFHKAQIFIDTALNIPIRYCAYDWPKVPGGEPEVIEEYTYQNIRLNVGLSDKDFDRENPKYNF
ncbi:MAG: DUF1571 domain-containing protein [Planctomycetota bacterium]|nr:MAG: DUF1571 domain-containing protein [Planctomycetota bacterium]